MVLGNSPLSASLPCDGRRFSGATSRIAALGCIGPHPLPSPEIIGGCTGHLVRGYLSTRCRAFEGSENRLGMTRKAAKFARFRRAFVREARQPWEADLLDFGERVADFGVRGYNLGNRWDCFLRPTNRAWVARQTPLRPAYLKPYGLGRKQNHAPLLECAVSGYPT